MLSIIVSPPPGGSKPRGFTCLFIHFFCFWPKSLIRPTWSPVAGRARPMTFRETVFLKSKKDTSHLYIWQWVVKLLNKIKLGHGQKSLKNPALEHIVFAVLLPPQLSSRIGPSLVFLMRLHGGPIQFSHRFILKICNLFTKTYVPWVLS